MDQVFESYPTRLANGFEGSPSTTTNVTELASKADEAYALTRTEAYAVDLARRTSRFSK